MGIGKGAIGRLKIGISPSSQVRISKVPIRERRPICFLLCGPEKMVSTISSSGNEGIIASFFRKVGREVCPINQLSCSASKVLVLAGSKRFTGLLVRPDGRVRGICITGVGNVPSGRDVEDLREKIILRSKGATPTGAGLLSVSGGGRATVIRVDVRRKHGHRIEEVFRTVNRPILGLGERECNCLALRNLSTKSTERLATRRIGRLQTLTVGGG